jgi:hypothetical protein
VTQTELQLVASTDEVAVAADASKPDLVGGRIVLSYQECFAERMSYFDVLPFAAALSQLSAAE